MRRFPAVGGQFYPSDGNALKKMLGNFLSKAEASSLKPLALISPHAGYVFSGQCAAYSYAILRAFDFKNAVILSPNHTGIGAPVSVYPEGEWVTPLGEMRVNQGLAAAIGKEFWLDGDAHAMEHSVEVQLPFLQCIKKDVSIVPITIGDQSLGTMKRLGKCLAGHLGKDDMVIASTDFSHYVPEKTAKANDMHAIKAIEELNEGKLYQAIKQYSISMCGYGGVAASIAYAKEKGAKKGRLLNYDTSATASHDASSVVGYASMVLE